MRRWALAVLVALAAACASTPARRESPPDRDRTDDPDFQAAREAMRPDYRTEADALAAGVYEPFVPPDSVRPARLAAPVPTGGDPTTAEILGTLPGDRSYNPPGPVPVPADRETPDRVDETTAGETPVAPAPAGDAEAGRWTLQLGAYTTETGALVRIRQLERDFPDWPRWYAAEGGIWRVYVGRFADRAAADRGREAAASRGYADAWVTRAP